MRPSLFWDVTQRMLLVNYRCFRAWLGPPDPWRWDPKIVPRHR